MINFEHFMKAAEDGRPPTRRPALKIALRRSLHKWKIFTYWRTFWFLTFVKIRGRNCSWPKIDDFSTSKKVDFLENWLTSWSKIRVDFYMRLSCKFLWFLAKNGQKSRFLKIGLVGFLRTCVKNGFFTSENRRFLAKNREKLFMWIKSALLPLPTSIYNFPYQLKIQFYF